jgi:hypothetical protein
MELRDAIDYIGAPAGGLIGWLLGRRKTKAEAIALEVKALREVVQEQRAYITDLLTRIEALEDEVKALRRQA